MFDFVYVFKIIYTEILVRLLRKGSSNVRRALTNSQDCDAFIS